MQNTFGSHWRWRLLLLLAIVSLVAGVQWLAPWWNVDIVPGGTSRVVALVRVGSRSTVKVLDETTGQFQNVVQFEEAAIPSTLRVVREGTALGWRQGSRLFVADLKAPYSQKSWTISSEIKIGEFEGISSDEHFAILQSPVLTNFFSTASGTWKTERGLLLRVVDLTRGEVVSSVEAQTPIESTRAANEFRFAPVPKDSKDGSDMPISHLWRLNQQGEWEALEAEGLPTAERYERIRLAQSPEGAIRLISNNEKVRKSETEILGFVVGISPAGQLLVEPWVGTRDRVWVGRIGEGELRLLDTAMGYSEIAFPRDNVAAAVNRWDDVVLFNLTTGKVIDTFAFGTLRKKLLGALAIGALMIVALWTWCGARERSSWWSIDAAAATACIPLAALIWLVANHHTWQMTIAMGPRYGHLACIVGTLAGASVLTGWYWAYGRGHTPVRWLIGGCWLFVLCLYVSRQVVNEQLQINGGDLWEMDVVWSLCMAGSLIVAGTVATALLVVKAIGWSTGDAPSDEPSHHFTLTSMLVGIVGVSALVALASAAPIETYWPALRWILIPLLVALVAINLLVSLILCRSVWGSLPQAFLFALLLPVIEILVQSSLRMIAPWPPGTTTWIAPGFLAGAFAPVIIVSGLARCHGWRWFRATSTTRNLPAEETAREIALNAPQSAVV